MVVACGAGANGAGGPAAAARLDAAQGRARRRYWPEGGARHRRGDRAHGKREWRKTRLFRSHEQAELAGAIADTRAMFEGRVGVNAAERDGINWFWTGEP
jgi:hypothetical protein